MSQVAEDSLLGGSKKETAVSTVQDDSMEDAPGVWYVSDASYWKRRCETNATHDFWTGKTNYWILTRSDDQNIA